MHQAALATLLAFLSLLICRDASGQTSDNRPKRGERLSLTVRASQIDPQVRAYPEISFLLEEGGKPQDEQHALVDMSRSQKGQLVIWLMAHNPALFDVVADLGLHAIHVQYARGWFGQFGNNSPGEDGMLLGNIRAEAALGRDFSPLVEIAYRDSVAGRATAMVKHLAEIQPEGQWRQFLDGDQLRWDKVILCGASHGSTTAARMAKEIRVARVVMFCGPRDQDEQWQSLPSATPTNRYFGFSHVLDTGWTGEHYCRSWQMLGLQQYGPIVNVDQTSPPYMNSRRLITDADVDGDKNRAHSSVTPGKAAVHAEDGSALHLPVWQYLFSHDVESTGAAVPLDPSCGDGD